MPCESCLVDCDKRIDKGNARLALNSNLVLVDCPCRVCLVRIMCKQSCIKEKEWVLQAIENDDQISDAVNHLRKINGE